MRRIGFAQALAGTAVTLLAACAGGGPPASHPVTPPPASGPSPFVSPAAEGPAASPSAPPTAIATQVMQDDTVLLQSKLAACVPGGATCTIRLPAGTFRTRQLSATGFHGTIAGEGIGKTVIQALPGYVVTPGYVLSRPPSATNVYPAILAFGGPSDVTITDLTFRVTEADPVPGGWYENDDRVHNTFLAYALSVQGSAHLTRVAFEGSRGSLDAGPGGQGVNLEAGVAIDGSRSPQGGDDFTMTRCTVRNAEAAVLLYRFGGHALVGGSTADGNTFVHSGAGIFTEIDGAVIEASYNRIADDISPASAIVIDVVGSVTAPSHVLVAHNRITLDAGGTQAVRASQGGQKFGVAQGAGAEAAFELTVADNTLVLGGDGSDTGILLRNTVGTVVSRNTIQGKGTSAIELVGTTQATVAGNAVGGFVPSGEAHITLDVNTSGARVNCARPADTVADQGTRNTVTGCSPSK